MNKKLFPIIGICAVVILTVVAVSGCGKSNEPEVGSIETGQEYYATSTIHGAVVEHKLIKNGYGSLAQVTVTGAGGSAFSLIDATSTESLATDPRISTSTQLLATIPANLAAGTYTFDATYNRGLFIYYDVVDTHPTTTILYR